MSPDLIASSLAYYFTADASVPRPSAWQLSLHTATPGGNGTANEVTDSAYARQSVTFSDPDLANPLFPLVSNSALVSFPAASSSYTATHVVVWDVTRSAPLVIQRLIADKAVPIGSQAQLAIGELKIGGVI
ncbi:phage tail fiber protein [Pseudomonas sp. GG8]